MDNLQKIGKIEAIAILIVITINQIITNLPNIIIINTGSSAWINVIYITIVAVLFCILICKLFKPFPTSDIIDISEFLGGKFLKNIIGIAYALFFIFITGITLRYLTNSLKLIYFQQAPIIFLLLLFLIPSVISSKLGSAAVCRVNLIFTPIFIFSIFLVVISTSKNFSTEGLVPILGYGFKETFLIGLNNIFAFSGLSYLYFLIPKLKNPDKFKKIALSSTIISAIYLFLTIISLLMLFPFITFSEELLSIYLLSRIIEFGRFFQRVDALFIFIWILSFLSFLSFTFNIIADIFKKLFKLKAHKELIYSISSLIFGVSLITTNIANIKFIQNIVFKCLVISLVFIIVPIILILANLKLKRRKYNEN